MKKGLLIILAGLVSFTSISMVNAASQSDTITNKSGVVIPVDKYNALASIYSSNFMNFMTQEQYDIIKDKDLSKVEIVETTDADIQNNGISTCATEHTTESKSLTIINNSGYITLSLSWYKVPTIKKYDVMAVRKNSSVTLSSGYVFSQYYVSNNTLYVNHDKYNQNFDNGFGATFKIINGTNHEMDFSFTATGSGRIYGSYQHASHSSATLENAMDYTLSGSGYGGVILFNPKIESKFDAMGGVYLTI